MIAGVLLLICGIAVLAAEVWLATIGTPLGIVVALLALTGFTEYIVAREVWEDLRA